MREAEVWVALRSLARRGGLGGGNDLRGESDGGFIRSADLWGHLVRKCKCFLSAIFFVGSSCQPDEHLKPLHPLFFFFFPFPFSKKQQFLGWTCVLQRTWPASLLYRRGSGPHTPVVVSFPAFGSSGSSLTTRIYLPFQLLACQWRRDSLPCRLPDHVHLHGMPVTKLAFFEGA